MKGVINPDQKIYLFPTISGAIMNTESLLKNKEYVDRNRHELLNLYRNKFILVVDSQVISSFDRYEQAAEYGVMNYGIEGGFYIEQMVDVQPVNFVLSAVL